MIASCNELNGLVDRRAVRRGNEQGERRTFAQTSFSFSRQIVRPHFRWLQSFVFVCSLHLQGALKRADPVTASWRRTNRASAVRLAATHGSTAEQLHPSVTIPRLQDTHKVLISRSTLAQRSVSPLHEPGGGSWATASRLPSSGALVPCPLRLSLIHTRRPYLWVPV